VNEWLILAGGLITVIGSYGAARYAGRSSVKVKEIDIEAGAYERVKKINDAAFERLEKDISDLSKKVGEQGAQISALLTDNRRSKRIIEAFANYVEEVLLWDDSGGKPPRPPIPDILKPILQAGLVGEHERQNRES
jgi:hypothetical protein